MRNSRTAHFCPQEESWRRLIDEALPSPQREELEAHLESRGDCRTLLVKLAEDDRIGPTSSEAAIGASIASMLARLVVEPPIGGSDASPAFQGPGQGEVARIPGYVDLLEVGRGGMGVVFRARQVTLDRLVAIKMIATTGVFDRTARSRAIREALTMARHRHPNVVAIHESGKVDGVPYLAMRWIEGGTLQERLEEGAFSHRDAARMVFDLAKAVGAAYALGMVHRDLKPGNILLTAPTEDDPAGSPKLADFGLARCWGEDRGVTATGMVLGTPGFMAPEQTGLTRSCGEVGPATDIHALGAILHALLAGRPPYRSDSTWVT